jgi:AcrR family transcriptional regulator
LIVEAAWSLVAEEGLAALSIRDLAKRAGISTPTVYAYFDSKHAIYDAMFGQAAEQFHAVVSAPFTETEPRAVLAAGLHRFIDFCAESVPRYQLLFQRTIPGFVPSDESYAPAVEALASTRRRFEGIGITDPDHLDLWTAITTGLVDQQLSNDPGGDRWVRLVDDFVDMFLQYCAPTTKRKGGRR